jgi:biopolymer transport protein ExbB
MSETMETESATTMALTEGALSPEPGLARLQGFVDAGGPVVLILIALSVVALALIILKLWQFQSARLGDRRHALEALRLYREGRATDALALAARTRNPAAEVVAAAIRGRMRPDLSEAKVREEVTRLGLERLEHLRSHLRPLEIIAAIAPLLGLFGTVLGMIDAFHALEAAGSQVNPATLSGGIWEALLTTAVGLAVAMPVYIAHNWLERTVDRAAHQMEDLATRVFTADLSAPMQEAPRHAGESARPAFAAGK